MLCLEIWYMMLLVVLTGHLDDAEMAVDSISISMNINGRQGMMFIGLNTAISVRVSNELGSGRRSRPLPHRLERVPSAAA
ncbi:hypothetical protein QYE76_026372 [Lolium multiflorum]|uniref:Secreted protein n=1 Tax=Lolium multiflorum TaxID=4521 RepID=A0AAD8VXI0_LOLMU|nr:hypothetical protein QYE76_026372 [Lolium multiflorum]